MVLSYSHSKNTVFIFSGENVYIWTLLNENFGFYSGSLEYENGVYVNSQLYK